MAGKKKFCDKIIEEASCSMHNVKKDKNKVPSPSHSDGDDRELLLDDVDVILYELYQRLMTDLNLTHLIKKP